MKVLVTGGLGHIGSALIRAVPWALTVVDNLSTLRYCSLFELPAAVRFVEADVCTLPRPELVALVQGHDAVVHLAARTDATDSLGQRDAYFAVNLEGALRVAQACSQARVPLVFPSTTSVYGPQEATVDETLAWDRYLPASPYAASKLQAERRLTTLAEEPGLEGLRTAVLRFGTIYGISPGWRNHTAANRFCWQAAFGQPITVYQGAWAQLRPYCALADALAAIRWVVESPQGSRFDGSVRNVVTGNHTVAEVVAAIHAWERCFPGEALRVHDVDAPILNQLSYEVSAARIREEGFVFTGDLRRGIEETLALLLPDVRRALATRTG